jgi:hypothetical protein
MFTRMAAPLSNGNHSVAWSDESFGATEFLFADYRDFAFPLHVHETFAIGVIEAGGQHFQPGRSPSLIMPEGTLCTINPGVVHEGRPATDQGWRYRMFYPSSALVADALEDPRARASSGEWSVGQHVIDDHELYREIRCSARVVATQRNSVRAANAHLYLPSAVVRTSRQFFA